MRAAVRTEVDYKVMLHLRHRVAVMVALTNARRLRRLYLFEHVKKLKLKRVNSTETLVRSSNTIKACQLFGNSTMCLSSTELPTSNQSRSLT